MMVTPQAMQKSVQVATVKSIQVVTVKLKRSSVLDDGAGHFFGYTVVLACPNLEHEFDVGPDEYSQMLNDLLCDAPKVSGRASGV